MLTEMVIVADVLIFIFMGRANLVKDVEQHNHEQPSDDYY